MDKKARNKVNEVLLMKSNLISPAFAFGRRPKVTGIEEEFILAFFLRCSDEEIETLNNLASGFEEVTIEFFQQSKIVNGIYELTPEDKKSFNFCEHTWNAYLFNPVYDRERGIVENRINVVFD